MVALLGVLERPAAMYGVQNSWAPEDVYSGDTVIGEAAGDFGYFAETDAESMTETCPTVRVFFVDRENTEFDRVYNEAPNGIVYEDTPLEIPAMVLSGGEEAEINELGLDKASSVTVTFSNLLLQRAGKEISLGDVIDFNGKTYQTVKVNQKDHLVGLNWPLHTVCVCKVALDFHQQETPTEQTVPIHKSDTEVWETPKQETPPPRNYKSTLAEVLTQEG